MEDTNEYIVKVKSKIKSWTYRLIDNKCLCWNNDDTRDIIISKKDRYWFEIPQILCTKCWLIRSWLIFDETSNTEFYKKEYRPIYVPQNTKLSKFFENQQSKGEKFYELFSKYVKSNTNLTVFDAWCGAWWMLIPRKEKWFKTKWCDFNTKYLNFWKSKWLDLMFWDVEDILKNEEIDVLILSHVFEHFINPIQKIQSIINHIKRWWYLIFEVPGIFSIHQHYYKPIEYFQNAHVYNYYKDYLFQFFEKIWLNVIYWDERCTFILQKPVDYMEYKVNQIVINDWEKYSKKILRYLKINKYFYWINPFFIADRLLKPIWLYKLWSKLYFKIINLLK